LDFHATVIAGLPRNLPQAIGLRGKPAMTAAFNFRSNILLLWGAAETDLLTKPDFRATNNRPYGEMADFSLS
ncbi:MAG: hypothetical protein FWF44_02040, partial [Defluviitaleaceae bacterium]|nr:hypothetical protein [Defluviitaleaceae bacterium]